MPSRPYGRERKERRGERGRVETERARGLFLSTRDPRHPPPPAPPFHPYLVGAADNLNLVVLADGDSADLRERKEERREEGVSRSLSETAAAWLLRDGGRRRGREGEHSRLRKARVHAAPPISSAGQAQRPAPAGQCGAFHACTEIGRLFSLFFLSLSIPNAPSASGAAPRTAGWT